jgi:hypothetical protein
MVVMCVPDDRIQVEEFLAIEHPPRAGLPARHFAFTDPLVSQIAGQYLAFQTASHRLTGHAERDVLPRAPVQCEIGNVAALTDGRFRKWPRGLPKNPLRRFKLVISHLVVVGWRTTRQQSK